MKKYKILTLMVLLLILTGSCEKFVEGYDKDPNGLLETNTEQIMQGVLLENQFFLKADGIRMEMLWINQATGSDRQFVAFNNWNNVGNNHFNDQWSEVYTTLSEARVMEDLANQIGNIKARGIAKLYRAWSGGQAASLWGDVPFSQAGMADKYPNPVYDSQADVFAQVQTLLDEAIADLNDPVGTIYADKDIYFNGDASKWVKIAHGLKARFYLHAGDYANAKTEALMGPGSGNDDITAPFDSYVAPSGKWNPTFQFYWNRDGYLSAQDAFAVELTNNGGRNNAKTNDLVRGYYNYAPGNWWGSSSDWDLNVMIPNWIGAYGKFGGPMRLLSYGEMLLIQAEAEARINDVTAALPIYNQYRALLAGGYDTAGWEAVLGAPLKYDAYVAADFAAGGMENADNVTDKQAFLREIMEERYVFFIGDYEAFIDHARSHNDPDVPSYITLKSGFTGEPLRFIYPQSEIDSNDNFPGTAPAVTQHLPIYN